MLEVKTFPKDMSVFEVNRSDAKECFLSGLFEESVKLENETRRFYTYLKPGLHYNQPCLIVAPPSCDSVLDWLEESFWLSFAEEHDLFLHIMIPENGVWKPNGIDADYMNKVYMQIQSRQAYVTMQDNIYAFGLGDGAIIAQQAVMKMSSEWSGLASFGELNSFAMLNAEVLHGAESTGKTELSINAAKVQVPVWMGWKENTGDNAAVCAYWKKQNDTDAECFANAFADEIYFPTTVCKPSQINEEKISQVRVTNDYTGSMTRELADAVWAYLSKACRHRGFGEEKRTAGSFRDI